MNPRPLASTFSAIRVALLAAAVLPWMPIAAASQQLEPESVRERLVIRTEAGSEHAFEVEIADVQSEILRGLTMRGDLPEDEGMLFVFPDSGERSFWMRNTYIGLDILFLQDDGRISRIHPNAIPGDLTSIPSGGPVSRVLEIGAGLAARLGIREGDVVVHPGYFRNRGIAGPSVKAP